MTTSGTAPTGRRPPAGRAPHRLPLGTAPWSIWRESALRSAGFPAARIELLNDPELASLAARSGTSSSDRSRFDQRWPSAVTAAQAAARTLAGDPRFREAVAWQNPEVVRNCLDVSRLRRKHELAIASYAQRYLLKNDTIGFFGPLAWARWTDGESPLRVLPGPDLVARREVYFETWAIDAVAERLGAEPELRRWLRPRLVASCLLDGTLLWRPQLPPWHLAPAQAAMLSRCDGSRPVTGLATELGVAEAELLQELRGWRNAGVVHLDFAGPVEARPEATLRGHLARIGESGARNRALAVLSEVESARDAVVGAAGDADAVLAATARLATAFTRATGSAATRRPGEAYAGRTLVYLDAQRDVTVELGRPLRELLAPPLALVLDSARWLVARVAEGYQRALADLYDRCAARAGSAAVPLASLLAAATPLFLAACPWPLAEALTDLQQRWARVLRIPPGVARHRVSVESVADRVRAAFPPAPPPWAAAACHSPDVLIAAGGTGPAAAGDAAHTADLTLVLGELHVARNTLENRPLVEFHEQPSRLLAAVEADYGGRRVYHVPPKEWPQVNPRTYPSPLLSPQFTHWCRYDDRAGAAGPVLPAGGMTVHRYGGRLVVRSRTGGVELDLVEMLGEQLSNVVAGAFRPLPESGHQPRIVIDRLVVQRESWTFDAGDLDWVTRSSRAERFRLAQLWREQYRLPVRVFYREAGEKPVFVDFRSVSLVELLARATRRAATRSPPGRLTLTEMLPDVDQTWLVDAHGAGYTAELRLVAVDRYGSGSPTGRETARPAG